MPERRSPANADDARARLRGKRAALAVVIVVAVAFIGASAAQIIPAVFGAGASPVPEGPAGSSARRCADGIRGLERALDRAAAQTIATGTAAAADGDEAALAALRQGLSPEWDAEDAIRTDCAASREGVEAWAALERLRRGEEELARRARLELGPMRRDVAAHLPGPTPRDRP
jgi:hypothetical protein